MAPQPGAVGRAHGRDVRGGFVGDLGQALGAGVVALVGLGDHRGRVHNGPDGVGARLHRPVLADVRGGTAAQAAHDLPAADGGAVDLEPDPEVEARVAIAVIPDGGGEGRLAAVVHLGGQPGNLLDEEVGGPDRDRPGVDVAGRARLGLGGVVVDDEQQEPAAGGRAGRNRDRPVDRVRAAGTERRLAGDRLGGNRCIAAVQRRIGREVYPVRPVLQRGAVADVLNGPGDGDRLLPDRLGRGVGIGDLQVGHLDDDRVGEDVVEVLAGGAVAVLVHRVAGQIGDERPDLERVGARGHLLGEGDAVGRLADGHRLATGDGPGGASQNHVRRGERPGVDRLAEGHLDGAEGLVPLAARRHRGHVRPHVLDGEGGLVRRRHHVAGQVLDLRADDSLVRAVLGLDREVDPEPRRVQRGDGHVRGVHQAGGRRQGDVVGRERGRGDRFAELDLKAGHVDVDGPAGRRPEHVRPGVVGHLDRLGVEVVPLVGLGQGLGVVRHVQDVVRPGRDGGRNGHRSGNLVEAARGQRRGGRGRLGGEQPVVAVQCRILGEINGIGPAAVRCAGAKVLDTPGDLEGLVPADRIGRRARRHTQVGHQHLDRHRAGVVVFERLLLAGTGVGRQDQEPRARGRGLGNRDRRGQPVRPARRQGAPAGGVAGGKRRVRPVQVQHRVGRQVQPVHPIGEGVAKALVGHLPGQFQGLEPTGREGLRHRRDDQVGPQDLDRADQDVVTLDFFRLGASGVGRDEQVPGPQVPIQRKGDLGRRGVRPRLGLQGRLAGTVGLGQQPIGAVQVQRRIGRQVHPVEPAAEGIAEAEVPHRPIDAQRLAEAGRRIDRGTGHLEVGPGQADGNGQEVVGLLGLREVGQGVGHEEQVRLAAGLVEGDDDVAGDLVPRPAVQRQHAPRADRQQRHVLCVEFGVCGQKDRVDPRHECDRGPLVLGLPGDLDGFTPRRLRGRPGLDDVQIGQRAGGHANRLRPHVVRFQKFVLLVPPVGDEQQVIAARLDLGHGHRQARRVILVGLQGGRVRADATAHKQVRAAQRVVDREIHGIGPAGGGSVAGALIQDRPLQVQVLTGGGDGGGRGIGDDQVGPGNGGIGRRTGRLRGGGPVAQRRPQVALGLVVGLSARRLIEPPVGGQARLVAREDAVHPGRDLGLRQGHRPDADLVDRAREEPTRPVADVIVVLADVNRLDAVQRGLDVIEVVHQRPVHVRLDVSVGIHHGHVIPLVGDERRVRDGPEPVLILHHQGRPAVPDVQAEAVSVLPGQVVADDVVREGRAVRPLGRPDPGLERQGQAVQEGRGGRGHIIILAVEHEGVPGRLVGRAVHKRDGAVLTPAAPAGAAVGRGGIEAREAAVGLVIDGHASAAAAGPVGDTGRRPAAGLEDARPGQDARRDPERPAGTGPAGGAGPLAVGADPAVQRQGAGHRQADGPAAGAAPIVRVVVAGAAGTGVRRLKGRPVGPAARTAPVGPRSDTAVTARPGPPCEVPRDAAPRTRPVHVLGRPAGVALGVGRDRRARPDRHVPGRQRHALADPLALDHGVAAGGEADQVRLARHVQEAVDLERRSAAQGERGGGVQRQGPEMQF